MLPRLQAMKEGEMQLVAVAGGVQVLRVANTKSAPVDEAAAAARIQQFLFNQRSIEAIAREMNQLKQAAQIEYVGGLANEPVAANESPATALPASNLDKGIRGLR
jgi:hypothetical protein